MPTLRKVFLAITLLGFLSSLPSAAQGPQLPPGTVVAYAGKPATPPPGWLSCQGQELEVRRFPALFAVIGTVYGGDGVNKFRLPDLRGRVVLGVGQGTELSNRQLGQKGGAETVTLTVAQMPAHSHVQTNDDDTGAQGGRNQTDGNGGGETAGRDSGTTRKKGGDQPHENMPPFLVLTYLIKQ